MFKKSTPHPIDRSAPRHRRRVSLWVLVWIFLSQFPIPIAHAHTGAARDDLHLAWHIDQKHAAAADDTDHLHWHLLMPWEVDGKQDSDDSSHHSSPLGLWGAEGSTLLHSETAVDGPLEPWRWVVCDRVDSRLFGHQTRPLARTTRCRGSSFMQTYDVPLCTLVCISLR